MDPQPESPFQPVPGAFPPSPPSPALSPFPLLDLPQECILAIIEAVDDERPYSPTFPAGPSSHLLSLSLTSTWFNTVCSPLVWRSVRYAPTHILRPAAWRRKRDLRALRELIKGRERLGMDALRVVQLSIEDPAGKDSLEVSEDQEEEDACVEVIEVLAKTSLQVLFLKSVEMTSINGQKLLRAIAASPRLSAIRFNQVDFWPNAPDVVDDFVSLPRIKTLQVMHSSDELFQLVDKCPSIDSLLLWPSTRRMGPRMNAIKALLPHLRNLSLDAVREAEVFRTLADEILRLSQGTPLTLPLEELFLEGPSQPADLSVLVSAIGELPNLQRLALYQVLSPKPALFNDLAMAAPQLRALTVVSGDCQEAVEWPAPLHQYLPSLSLFRSLRFFASDRRSPHRAESDDSDDSDDAQNALERLLMGKRDSKRQKLREFESMGKLAKAVPGLREAVAITSDVSEGSSGYFATFTRERGKTRIVLKHKTVNDFLIHYDRWVRVEDD
ncbi:hypothetical protein JCM8547_008536 [Rhodosporidiobolus lusitaniae]